MIRLWICNIMYYFDGLVSISLYQISGMAKKHWLNPYEASNLDKMVVSKSCLK